MHERPPPPRNGGGDGGADGTMGERADYCVLLTGWQVAAGEEEGGPDLAGEEVDGRVVDEFFGVNGGVEGDLPVGGGQSCRYETCSIKRTSNALPRVLEKVLSRLAMHFRVGEGPLK